VSPPGDTLAPGPKTRFENLHVTRSRTPTLLSLILLGFILVGVPLVVSIVTAIARVDRLAEQTRADIMAVQQDAVDSRALLESATAMERSARQYMALKDASFQALFGEHREEERAILDRLSAHIRTPELAVAIVHVRISEEQVNDLVFNTGGKDPKPDFETAVGDLRDSVLAVTRAQNDISRQMASAVPDRARQLQRTLITQATLVIPISMGLAGLFFFIIAPPLRAIGRSIRRLGSGQLSEPIEVRGTRDLEQLGQRLEWLRNRLVELESQKSQFLRNVSHELKTPLTNIREGAELLIDDGTSDGDEEQSLVARIVLDNSIRLQQMIEALLRYGAEGDLAVDQPDQPVQLDQIIEEVIDRQSLAAAGRSVSIVQSLAPVRMIGSPKRLQVIVENLLSNALKYTLDGGRIEIRLAEEPGEIRLDVQDNGVGVPDEVSEQVFDWFFSGPRPAGSIVAGTGMGLAIAQEYAEQHDGMIRLLPSAEGAHFRLTISKDSRS